jgi:RNA polymerase sigma-54 factor
MQRLQLQQKLQQRLTPQQILQIKLLEYTSLELEEKILQELEENPALEEGADLIENEADPLDEFENENSSQEDFSLGDYLNEDEMPTYKLAEKQNFEDHSETFVVGERESFHEELIKQLHLRELDEIELKVGEYIIGNIDTDGYLRRELHAISDDLLFQADIDISVNDLRHILTIIQDFDPAGVGAENLSDCLILQLQRKNPTPAILLAIKVITTTFEEFTKKHYDRIIYLLKVTEEELKHAIHEITLLNPKPGSSLSDGDRAIMYFITPDFIAETIDGEVFTSLNNKNIPSLHVSQHYAEMMQDYSSNKANRSKENKAAVQFVKQKLDSAKWFIDALKQRQNTLTVTMEAIVDIQRNFFITGDECDLRPMILKDLAERTGLEISTISRVSNSKYVQTNYGVYPLKYFFSDGMQTDSGEEVSTREIKNILKEAIDVEEKRKPLTDEKLCDILNDKGYPLARRTVAKYREALGIPVARLRKEI